MTAAFKRKLIDISRVAQAARAGLAEVAPQTWREGEVREVPLDQLIPNPDNARVWYPVASLKKLADSIVVTGQLSPALAFFNTHDQLTLIDGHRRWKAAGLAGLTHVRVELRPPPASRQDLYLRSRNANQMHSAQTPLDDAMAWKRLLAGKVFRHQRELSLFLGVSESEVSRILALAKLPSAAQEALSVHEDLCGLKTLNAFREFFELAGEARTLALVEEVVRTGIGYREIVARKNKLCAPLQGRARAWNLPVQGGAFKGSIRVSQDGKRLELTLAGMQQAQAQDLAYALGEWLAHRSPAQANS